MYILIFGGVGPGRGRCILVWGGVGSGKGKVYSSMGWGRAW